MRCWLSKTVSSSKSKAFSICRANVLLLLDVGNQLGLKNTNLHARCGDGRYHRLFKGTRFAVMQFATKTGTNTAWTTDKSGIELLLKRKLLSGKKQPVG
jgi:hypothetical protein